MNAEVARETFSGIIRTLWLLPGDTERYTHADTHFLQFLQVTYDTAVQSRGKSWRVPSRFMRLPITRKQNSLRRTLHSHEKDGQAPFAQVPFPVREYVTMWKTQQDAVRLLVQ